MSEKARARMCTDEICDAVSEGRDLRAVSENWKRAAVEFMSAREPYLLY